MVSPGAVPGAIIRVGQSHTQGKLREWKHTGLSGHGRIESLVTVLSSFFMEAQKTETVDVKEGSDVTNNCPCGQCLGGRKAKSLLSLEGDFETYATIGDWKG